MTAHQYLLAVTDNAKYVRCRMDLAVAHDPGWEDDLRESNRSKEGAPFRYADWMLDKPAPHIPLAAYPLAAVALL